MSRHWFRWLRDRIHSCTHFKLISEFSVFEKDLWFSRRSDFKFRSYATASLQTCLCVHSSYKLLFTYYKLINTDTYTRTYRYTILKTYL